MNGISPVASLHEDDCFFDMHTPFVVLAKVRSNHDCVATDLFSGKRFVFPAEHVVEWTDDRRRFDALIVELKERQKREREQAAKAISGVTWKHVN